MYHVTKQANSRGWRIIGIIVFAALIGEDFSFFHNTVKTAIIAFVIAIGFVVVAHGSK